MSILIESQFTNLGVNTRISHILLAKAVIIMSVYGALSFGAFVASSWLAFPFLLSTYLLFTGLTGWAPLVAMDNRLKKIKPGSPVANLTTMAR